MPTTTSAEPPPADLDVVRAALEEILRCIDAGELDASGPERAHLVGSLDVVRRLTA